VSYGAESHPYEPGEEVPTDGMPTAWRHVIVGQSILAGTPFAPMMVKNGVDSTAVESDPKRISAEKVTRCVMDAAIRKIWPLELCFVFQLEVCNGKKNRPRGLSSGGLVGPEGFEPPTKGL
jgi:hypothetical protein